MDKMMAQFAMQMLQNNPDKANTPMGQELMRALQNGDEQSGINLANNLCRSNGVTPDQVLPQAGGFFKNMMMGAFRR